MEIQGKTKKVLALVVLLNVALLAVLVFFFFAIKSKNETISRNENIIETALAERGKIATLKTLVEETHKDREKLDSFLVDKEKIVEFLESVENLAKNERLSIGIGSLEERTDSASGVAVPTLNLSIDSSGSWSNVIKFLHLMENLPYHLSISKVNLRTDEGGARKRGEAIWSVTFDVSVRKNN